MNCIFRCLSYGVVCLLGWAPFGKTAEPGVGSVKRSEAEGKRNFGRFTAPRLNPSVPAPSELMPSAEAESSKTVERKNAAVEGLKEEDRFGESSAPLPNTMDGLNDKRSLGIGDRLSFKVVEDEVAPRTLVVTDSMEIDVPYIGRVPVANKTCKQFAFYVKRQLEKEYYYRATVLVGLDSAGNAARVASKGKVYVMGQVKSQGPMEIPIDETFTVTKAILRAGGFGPFANKRKVKLIRGGNNESSGKPQIIDCIKILEEGQRNKDIELGPEDIVTVPEKVFNIF